MVEVRHSREMTLLCSPKMIQHHSRAVADLPEGPASLQTPAQRNPASVIDGAFHRPMISATNHCAAGAARVGFLPR